MTLAQYIIYELVKRGICHIFGYIGAKNMAIIEAAYENPGMRYVNTYHEHSAAFAACGYAQVSGKVGIATSTSGPGATNMLTGIANAYCDSIPTLFITGQCGVKTLRNGLNIRNNSTQEVDIVSMAQPITKYAVQVTDASKIRYEIEKCLHIAADGRKGPVLLDLPEDLQFAEVEPAALKGYTFEVSSESIHTEQISTLQKWIQQSSRPILLLGNGARNNNEALNNLIKLTKIPVVSSFEGVDSCDNRLQEYLGMAGTNGLRCANFALTNSDLIISLGCSFWSRYTGSDKNKFAVEAKIVRVDIDTNELNARTVKEDELKINCSAKHFLSVAESILQKITPSQEWLHRVGNYKNNYFFENMTNTNSPYDYVYEMSNLINDGDIVIADVGQHQLWVLQSVCLSGKSKMLNSGGLSTMGYAIPAAIGAHFASPCANIVVVVGDGCLQMTSSELETYVREKLPITVIVMNNGTLGLIKQLQATYYGGKYYASEIDYTVPDFVKLADVYGLSAKEINTVEQFDIALLSMSKPNLLNVKIDSNADVRPRIIQRRPIEDLYPFISDDELANSMIVPYSRVVLKEETE